MPGMLPEVDTTGTCVKIGPETFTLWADDAGQVCKIEITPLGPGHPHGPPGFYQEIGGVLPAPPPAAEEPAAEAEAPAAAAEAPAAEAPAAAEEAPAKMPSVPSSPIMAPTLAEVEAESKTASGAA